MELNLDPTYGSLYAYSRHALKKCKTAIQEDINCLKIQIAREISIVNALSSKNSMISILTDLSFARYKFFRIARYAEFKKFELLNNISDFLDLK